MSTRENKVEKYLDDQVTAIGGITGRWVSPGHDGVPCRIVRLPEWSRNKIELVEVKTIDGKCSSEQIKEAARLYQSGLDVYVVFSHEGVNQYIKRISE